MLKREQKDYDAASSYYSSLMIVNIFLVSVIGLAAVVCIAYLEYLISIPTELVGEVKVTSAVNFALDLSSSWVMWFAGACMTGIMGLFINIALILNKERKRALLNRFMKKK